MYALMETRKLPWLNGMSDMSTVYVLTQQTPTHTAPQYSQHHQTGEERVFKTTVLGVHSSLYGALCAKCVSVLTSSHQTFEVQAYCLVPSTETLKPENCISVDSDLDYCDLDLISQSVVDIHRLGVVEREQKLLKERENSISIMRHNIRRLGAVLHYNAQIGENEIKRSQMVGRLINKSMTTGEYRTSVEEVCKQESGLREQLASIGRKLCADTHANFEDVKTLFTPPFTLE